jgi:hypothetical protein
MLPKARIWNHIDIETTQCHGHGCSIFSRRERTRHYAAATKNIQPLAPVPHTAPDYWHLYIISIPSDGHRKHIALHWVGGKLDADTPQRGLEQLNAEVLTAPQR